MKKLPPHITIIKGTTKGPSVIVMGAVHGNERLGARVIAHLQEKMSAKMLHGTLTLILGNHAAYAANKRFMDCDLNRLFTPALQKLAKKPATKLLREEKRALEIAPFLKNADYLLDIHSTIKPSVPFIFCAHTPGHYALAKIFSTHSIVSAEKKCHPADLASCTDNYVDRHGGIGITYEAGWHKDEKFFSEILDKTLCFLKKTGSIKMACKPTPQRKPVHLMIYEGIVPGTSTFRFTKNFANFDCIPKGTIIAYDGKKIIKADRKSYMIFPKMDIIPGKPAGYLATKLSSL